MTLVLGECSTRTQMALHQFRKIVQKLWSEFPSAVLPISLPLLMIQELSENIGRNTESENTWTFAVAHLIMDHYCQWPLHSESRHNLPAPISEQC